MRQRAYAGTADLTSIASLARMTGTEVRRFMDDANIDPRRDFGLWENTAGQSMAGALVAVRTGWFVFALADDVTLDEGRQVLYWALTRIEEHSHQKQEPTTATTPCTETDTLKRSLLTQAGFSPKTPMQYSMRLPLEQNVEDVYLPESYQLRLLDPISDFHTYQDFALATFGYQVDAARWGSMISSWNVNLVIHTETCGKEILVAACRGIIRDEENELGARNGLIADLGTRPEYQRQGLGRAVLQGCLGQLWQRGVTEIRLDTDNPGAKALYEASGFTIAHQWRIYARDLEGWPS